MSGVRPPKIRLDYMGDAQALLHLTRAIAADDKRPVKWRTEVIDGLKDLAEKLIKAPKLGDDRQQSLPIEPHNQKAPKLGDDRQQSLPIEPHNQKE